MATQTPHRQERTGTKPTPRTVVAEIVTDYQQLRYPEFDVWCAIAACSQDTIHRVRP